VTSATTVVLGNTGLVLAVAVVAVAAAAVVVAIETGRCWGVAVSDDSDEVGGWNAAAGSSSSSSSPLLKPLWSGGRRVLFAQASGCVGSASAVDHSKEERR